MIPLPSTDQRSCNLSWVGRLGDRGYVRNSSKKMDLSPAAFVPLVSCFLSWLRRSQKSMIAASGMHVSFSVPLNLKCTYIWHRLQVIAVQVVLAVLVTLVELDHSARLPHDKSPLLCF